MAALPPEIAPQYVLTYAVSGEWCVCVCVCVAHASATTAPRSSTPASRNGSNAPRNSTPAS
eukprot:2380015-Rhodomonas_salina.1